METITKLTLTSLGSNDPIVSITTTINNKLLPFLVKNRNVNVLVTHHRQLHSLLQKTLLPLAVRNIPAIVIFEFEWSYIRLIYIINFNQNSQ